MGALPPQEVETHTIVTFGEPLWRPLHPKMQKIMKSAKYHDSRDFQEFQRILQKCTFLAKMVPYRRDAPPKPSINLRDFNDLGGASGGGAVFVRKVENLKLSRNHGSFMKSQDFVKCP